MKLKMNQRNELQCLSTKNSCKKEPVRLQSQSALPILDVKRHDYSIGIDGGETAQNMRTPSHSQSKHTCIIAPGRSFVQ